MLDPDGPPVVTDFVPFRIDNRFELFCGGGKSKVGENAGAEAGTCCPWGYRLCGITCSGGGGPRTCIECWGA